MDEFQGERMKLKVSNMVGNVSRLRSESRFGQNNWKQVVDRQGGGGQRQWRWASGGSGGELVEARTPLSGSFVIKKWRESRARWGSISTRGFCLFCFILEWRTWYLQRLGWLSDWIEVQKAQGGKKAVVSTKSRWRDDGGRTQAIISLRKQGDTSASEMKRKCATCSVVCWKERRRV